MNIKEKTSLFFEASVTVDSGPDLGRNYKISNPTLLDTISPNVFKVENNFTDDIFTIEYISLKNNEIYTPPYDFYLKITNSKNPKNNCLRYFFEINDNLISIQYNFSEDKYYLCKNLNPVNVVIFENFFSSTHRNKNEISDTKEQIKNFILEIENFIMISPHRDSILTSKNDPLYYVDFIFSDTPIITWEDFYKKYKE